MNFYNHVGDLRMLMIIMMKKKKIKCYISPSEDEQVRKECLEVHMDYTY